MTLGYSLCLGRASAQLVSVGVKGGVSITEPGRYNDESRRYIVGPSVEFRLPFRFAAEIDALYTRTGDSFRYLYFYPDPAGMAGTTTDIRVRTRGNSWEFPVLGKYYFTSRQHAIQPFVGTGYTLSTTWVRNDVQTSVLSLSPIATTQPTLASNSRRTPFDVGAVVAAGVRVKAGRFSVLPELRYTHWGPAATAVRKNQAKFLLGISF
jgi:hypothetical protein